MSTDSHPIKVVNAAPNTAMRADKIAIETAKTGKVTAVVAVMNIFVERNASCRALVLGTRSLLPIRQKVPNFLTKIPAS
jgi:hypothetical protein